MRECVLSRMFRYEEISQNTRLNARHIANNKVQKNSMSEILPRSVRSMGAYAHHRQSSRITYIFFLFFTTYLDANQKI